VYFTLIKRFRCYIFVPEKKNCPFMTNNKNLGKRIKNQNHTCTIHRNTTSLFKINLKTANNKKKNNNSNNKFMFVINNPKGTHL
jgi:hypothetical protein